MFSSLKKLFGNAADGAAPPLVASLPDETAPSPFLRLANCAHLICDEQLN
jgi:hypothetical protein